jgi:membrane-bound ClpP family serine protease
METNWQKRVNRKFKVLGIVTAVFGLALIIFGFGAYMTPQIPLSVAGVGLIVLGAYFFIDEFRILDEGESA